MANCGSPVLVVEKPGFGGFIIGYWAGINP